MSQTSYTLEDIPKNVVRTLSHGSCVNTMEFHPLQPFAADIRFPDEHTLCIENISIGSTSMEYCFDQVYGPDTAQETSRNVQLDCSGKAVEVVQQRIDNPSDFATVFKFGLQNQSACTDDVASKNGNLIVTFHIYYSSNVTAEKRYSKLSLIDMASDTAFGEGNGSVPVNITFSELLDVVSASRTMKDYKPFGKSSLMEILSYSVVGTNVGEIVVWDVGTKESIEFVWCMLPGA